MFVFGVVLILILIFVCVLVNGRIFKTGHQIIEKLAECSEFDKNLQVSLSALSSQIGAIKSDIDGIKGQIDANGAKIDQVETQMGKNTSFIDSAKQQMKDIEAEIKKNE